MSTPQVSEEEVVRQLATEIRLLEGSVNALQARLEMVRAAISEVTLAHSTLEGLKNLQNGDSTLIPVGAGTYVRMSVADSKNHVMMVGAGVAMEKTVEGSVVELGNRLQDFEKARTAIQQQLDQTVARYQQDREALEELLRRQQSLSTNKAR